ncbi:MAG: Grx4 family monothiol glutaredoxin [Bdellovibrionales bacterium]|nr:Grx4 family monothiol glutaredoxin [Bdellovibrionales bacterium]
MSTDPIKEELEREINSNPIILYIKGEKDQPVCGFSMRVVQVFKELGVPFETRNVLLDPQRLAKLKEMANWPTTPQVYIDGELIGGCDITLEMFQSGELQTLVEKYRK